MTEFSVYTTAEGVRCYEADDVDEAKLMTPGSTNSPSKTLNFFYHHSNNLYKALLLSL